MAPTVACEIVFKQLFYDVERIRQKNPIIHNISNLVVMPITANLLLSLGASPIMAHAQEELAEILSLAKALVINIGTLDDYWINSITMAQEIALQTKIPIAFDPVGVGASHYRTETAKKILSRGVQVIRGNASEIMALVDPHIKTKGVDSLQTSESALPSAVRLAKKYHCTVVVSGKIDLIVDQSNYVTLQCGTPLFTKVVGMGCSLTAIIGSFLAVNQDPFLAAVHAMTIFGLTGELAAKTALGPGSFYTQLLDHFYKLEPSSLESLVLNRQYARKGIME